jgi:dihydrofolate reductase
MKWVVASVSGAGGFLLGRRTYEIFAAHWPIAPEEEQVLAGPMNRLPKYVASRSLSKPLKWQPSTLLQGDVAQAVRRLKQEDGKDLRAIGSAQLVQALIENELVDEFQLMIDPVVVGGGKRLFRDGGSLRRLRLVDSQTTTTGAIIATYVPATG